MTLDVTESDLLKGSIDSYDLVVSAVPGFLGFETLKSIIEAKKDVVDISFFAENALDLHQLAADRKVTALVDCGVAPGMGNIILGHHNESMKVSHFECLVGGLPVEKKWPFGYKAPFSPIDVIEEYTRPARFVEHGNMVVREALSDCELIYFPGVGTLEAFNSDGLRSLIHTMPDIPNLKEKTLRYPGHVDYIRVLKESGFFENEEMDFQGTSISPLEFTSQVLFKEWQLEEGEKEFTVMRIRISGEYQQQDVTFQYDLLDYYDETTSTSSMARTTGYTATACAELVLNGLFDLKGVYPPELVGRSETCFNSIMEYLRHRNVKYSKSMTAE